MQAAAPAGTSTHKQWAVCLSALQSERSLASGLERQKGSFLQSTAPASARSALLVPSAQAPLAALAQPSDALCTPCAGPDFGVHVVGPRY